jgi:magnesium chelatase subunit I
MAAAYPFTAIVGQDEMKLAITIAAIDPSVGGVLAFGERGTGKSTAVRALAALLPHIQAVEGCPYQCDPANPCGLSDACAGNAEARETAQNQAIQVPVIDLPLGATEDRIVGALDLERALTQGEKAFEPGLLAKANRGFLYIDEANLLEDHLVDLLLDVAATGENIVEREGLSIRHPARFVLVGSGNPEEGELRPQLLDRFGLFVDVTAPRDLDERVQVIRRRDAFERDPEGFAQAWQGEQDALRAAIASARHNLASVDVPEQVVARAAGLCVSLGTDGLRGELTLIRSARALAALEGEGAVRDSHLRRVAPASLRHRLRRDPLDESGSGVRIERAIAEVFGDNAGLDRAGRTAAL